MESNFSEIVQDGGESKPSKKRALNKIILILALFILFSGVAFILLTKRNDTPGPVIGGGSDQRASVGMKKFESYGDLVAFVEDNKNSFVGSYDSKTTTFPESTGWSETSNAVDTTAGWGSANAPVGVPSEASTETPSDYSATNIQVSGVDEGDIVKTDGRYIYTISGQKVLIAQAVPANETEIVSTIELDYPPAGIYLSGDKMAVFGSHYDLKPLTDYALLPGGRNSGYSDLRIYDIGDRKAPRQEKQYDFEGSYSNSRLIGDYLYFVTAASPSWISYDDVRTMPYIMEDGAIMPQPANPEVYYFDFPYTSQNFTSVTAININDTAEDIKNETYMLDGNQNTMYVSADNMYISFSKYVSEEELMLAVTNEFLLPRLSEQQQQRIREIQEAKSYILSYGEKLEKTMMVYEQYFSSLSSEDQNSLSEELETKMGERYESLASEMQKTTIHKIAVEEGSLRYVSQGEVPGRVLNQYAMDEEEGGNFRIATTVDATWSGITGSSTKSFNNLYVLDADMKRLGALEHIAEGERIYSVRFMGERAYMVTFQRTDPLFVIGLRYPDSPVILGELKVPGYSTYLHPYGDNLLIGLGKEADENGRETGGIKLSLFDASDVANPKEVDKYVFGMSGSSSTALSDPKAFLFSKEKNLLVIPSVVRKSGISGNRNYTTEAAGSAVFRVDTTGFEFRGYIDHRTESEKNSSYYYAGDAKRNLYVGDNLYSISGNFLKVNKLENLEEVKSIALPGYPQNYMWGE